MKLYHSSPSLFYKFNALSHFGSFKAAMHRKNAYNSNVFYFYTVEIPEENIIEIEDFGNESDMFHDDLFRQNIISKNEFNILKNIFDYTKRTETLKNILIDKNIHILKYKNVAEDIDSTSFIVVDSSQIKITSIKKFK